jgi:histidine kinase-like protein
VLDYRLHGGRLPLGHFVLDFNQFGTSTIVLGMLAVLLFPDGRLEGRWRRAVWVYLGLAAVALGGLLVGQAMLHLSRHVSVDERGKLTASANQTGWWGAFILLMPIIVGFWIAFVVRQVRAWRRASGVQREQLKWLMSGAAVTLVATLVFAGGTASAGGVLYVVGAVAALAICSFPLAIGVGILKYRLYDIDRLISRTIAYALLTAALAGVFVGVVLLMTRVLPFSSSPAVAASTLAVAALFSPLRVRLQRVIDRRFNRARYDAEATVASFAARLRDSIDVDTVLDELAAAAGASLEPTSVSVWVKR